MDELTEIFKTLAARTEFITHLQQDIDKNNQILQETKNELHKLEEFINDIRSLGKYPEHSAMIPMAKNIYMKGRIVHTGEYYVTKPAHPEPYVILQSLDQTLKSLENRVKLKKSDIEKAEYAKYQLEERMRLLRGDTECLVPEDDLPVQIKSEKGVAVKVGEFYEILEFEED